MGVLLETIKQDFSSNARKKILCACILLDPDIKLKEMEQKFTLEDLLDTEISVWITFMQTPKHLDYMQFLMTLLDLQNLLRKKVLGIVMLHLVSPIHAFLVT